MSKGSKPRPLSVPIETFNESFDRIFGASSLITPEYQAEQRRLNTQSRAMLARIAGIPVLEVEKDGQRPSD